MSEKKLDHEFYMGVAIEMAKRASDNGEVPIGAVVVDGAGEIISKACNEIEKIGCQTGHAEILAIQSACEKVDGWRLDDCWLYVTLEPCSMCMGLITLSRIGGLVYGASSPLFGAEELDESPYDSVYKERLEVVKGLKAV
ncbi:nucleoside deaminase, partial [bacterium]|nr:nucleoside deaminase [bacterium]